MKVIKWNTPDSSDGERRTKQHAFISAKRGAYYMEKYDGNRSLCSKSGISDGDKYLSIEEIEGENLNPEKACKRCQNIFQTLNNKDHE